jgi:hypothetical protein
VQVCKTELSSGVKWKKAEGSGHGGKVMKAVWG